MYQSYPSLLIGFHGCKKIKGEALLDGTLLFEPSEERHDWLGSGMYFWENNSSRAWDWARDRIGLSHIDDEPLVVGAVIDLGHCLNLLDLESMNLLKRHYNIVKNQNVAAGRAVPENILETGRHYLDCAVIESVHKYIKDEPDNIEGLQPYDSVRAAYVEGEPIYPKAGFTEKNHIQICIRNPNCIKGYFLPRENTTDYTRV